MSLLILSIESFGNPRLAPPSTTNGCPVTNLASSEANQSAAYAISNGKRARLGYQIVSTCSIEVKSSQDLLRSHIFVGNHRSHPIA